jgi:hypothetical protein
MGKDKKIVKVDTPLKAVVLGTSAQIDKRKELKDVPRTHLDMGGNPSKAGNN